MAATKHGVAPKHLDVANKDRLMAADEQRDIAQCGRSLAEPQKPGSPNSAPTTRRPPRISSWKTSSRACASRMTRISSTSDAARAACWPISWKRVCADGRQASNSTPRSPAFAASWTSSFEGVDVIEGNALEIPLAPYSHLYLFNPFDTNLLERFIMKIEQDAAREMTMVHMSDNGETYSYIGRTGWSLVREGEFHSYRTASGRSFHVYDHPQHFSIWRYDPGA